MRFGRSRSPYSSAYYQPYYGSRSPSLLERVAKIVLVVLLVLLAVLLIAGVVRFFMTRWPVASASGPEIAIVPHVAAAPASASAAAPPDSIVAEYDEQGRLVRLDPPSAIKPDALPERLTPAASGITLEAAAAALSRLAVLEAAVYDPDRLQLLLIGQPGTSPFRPDDLRVAWRAALADNDPTVTIDPGPKRGEMVVKFTGPVTDTHFGWTMYEADREMKTLALGKDNITGTVVRAGVPGYKTHLELARELEADAATEKLSRHRFWFVPKGMRLVVSADGHEVQFAEAGLKVLTECTDAQLRPLKNCVAPAADAFAAHLTQYYDEYAQEFPVFNELRELGKLLSLGKWLRDMGIPVDEAWLATDRVAAMAVPKTTPAITVSTSTTQKQGNGTLTSTYSVYGGVNFHFTNTYENLPLGAPSVRKRVWEARPSENATFWPFTEDGQPRLAVVISPQPEYLPSLSASNTGIDLVLTQFGGVPLGVIRKPVWKSDTGRTAWTLDVPHLQPLATESFIPNGAAKPQAVPKGVVMYLHLDGPGETFTFKGWTKDEVRVFESKTLGFDGRPRAVTWTAADGYRLVDGPAQIEFDHQGRVRTLLDDEQKQVEFTYVGDQLRHIGREGGAEIDLTYRGAQLTEAKNQAGQEVGYQYDAGGRLLRIVDGRGKPLAHYQYDSTERLAAEYDDTQNRVYRNRYDESGVLTDVDLDDVRLSWSVSGKRSLVTINRLTGAQPAAAPASDDRRREALNKQLVVSPTDRAAVAKALTGLTGAELTELEQAAGRNPLHAYALTPGEIDFVNTFGPVMLPPDLGASPVKLTTYGAGDRKLAVDVDGAARPAAFQAALARVVEHYRLQQEAPESTVVSVTDAGTELRVVAGDKAAVIHASELESIGGRIGRMASFLPWFKQYAAGSAVDLALRNPARFGQLLREKALLPGTARVIDFANDLRVNLRAALKDRTVLTALTPDSPAILARLRGDRPDLTIRDVAVINGIPATEAGFKAGNMPGAWKAWEKVAPKVSELARKRNVEPVENQAAGAPARPSSGPVAQRTTQELMTKRGVVFVFAHSDGAQIYMGNGEWYAPSQLDAAALAQIRKQSPDVVLLSCKTGGLTDGRSLVRALLDAGAHSVTAPRNKVPVGVAQQMLQRFLDQANKGMSFDEARDLMLQLEGESGYQIFISRAPEDLLRQHNFS